MKKEQQQQKKNMKNETVTFVFSSSFPINIFFFFFYFLASHTFQWLYKSHWRWCAASLQRWPMNETIETGGDEEIYIHICINICPVLTQHRAGGCDEREAVEKCKRKKSRSIRGEATVGEAEPELSATNAARTTAAFVSPAGALTKKAIDSG